MLNIKLYTQSQLQKWAWNIVFIMIFLSQGIYKYRELVTYQQYFIITQNNVFNFIYNESYWNVFSIILNPKYSINTTTIKIILKFYYNYKTYQK